MTGQSFCMAVQDQAAAALPALRCLCRSRSSSTSRAAAGRLNRIALHLGAALGAHHLELLAASPRLRRWWSCRAPCARAVTGAHDGERADAVGEVLHERAVDLDLVEREAAQVARARSSRCRNRPWRCARRGRAAGAACRASPRCPAAGPISVISSSSRSAGRPEAASALDDRLDQAAAAELHRREVDGDLQVGSAMRGASCRPAAAPIRRSARSGPISSASGMKSAGGIMPRVGMVPAQQRLEAADLVASRG